MFSKDNTIEKIDPEVWASIQRESQRQEEQIELIASENYTSPAVLQAQGSILTNKYAEGYPGKRYYGGCEYVDEVETLAKERAKKLLRTMRRRNGCECPTSLRRTGQHGSIFALLNPGDTVMGMSLAEGGHLSTA